MTDQAEANSTAEPYPSQEAMEAAVRIEFMAACGGYATVAYGRAIQKAIDTAVAQVVPAPEGYEQLPEGVTCRCVFAWTEDGRFWCCKADPNRRGVVEPPADNCDHPQINKATERWNICPDCGQTWPRNLTG